MTQEKKERRFSTVQEILETYFPAYAAREREPSAEDYSRIGQELATKLAKKFQANLRR